MEPYQQYTVLFKECTLAVLKYDEVDQACAHRLHACTALAICEACCPVGLL